MTSTRSSTQPVFFDRERRLAWRRDLAAERVRARASAVARRAPDRRLADGRHPAGPGRKRAAGARPGADLRGLARRGRGPALSPAGPRHPRRPVRRRLVRAARRRRLRRRQRRPARAPRRGAARRDLRRARRRHVRTAAGGLARARRAHGRDRHALRRDHVRFATCQGALLDALARDAASRVMRRSLRAGARRAGAIRGHRRRRSAADLPRRPARLPARRARLVRRSCAGSGSAAASPTRWASARRSWCSRRWRPAASSASRPAVPRRPSLIVVPRSLVFNWKQEAARFAPALRVLDFTGSGRRDALDHVAEHDIVLTTYGTLRRDIGHLKDDRVRLRDPRRSAGDQERAHELGQGRAAAAGGSPARAQRHAGRESPRRALEPVRLSQSRDARRGVALRGGERHGASG